MRVNEPLQGGSRIVIAERSGWLLLTVLEFDEVDLLLGAPTVEVILRIDGGS